MFKSQGRIPVTNETVLNMVSNHDGFHLSYNPMVRDYGCQTTAIVLGNHALFFVLNGDHRNPLSQAVERGGKQAVIDYFIENVGQANSLSDHTHIFKDATFLERDKYAAEHLGHENIARIKQALKELEDAGPEASPEP
ncbi:hypothetical protein [Defluviimonas salinarum]|uniref:Uncharacterized protein n=1 Tax=Defluviimonas salinarum TaxID=2992147 RepID=A0ABT3J5G5_9RHOB|nr:hypothetical protein [Defluviimonas salinarum]MCW3782913.1 hypothetical protein [Defluviimonas salinarum]